MQPVPIFNEFATLVAFLPFSVQIVAAKPNSVALANDMTSCSVSKGQIVTTGPKISSFCNLEFTG